MRRRRGRSESGLEVMLKCAGCCWRASELGWVIFNHSHVGDGVGCRAALTCAISISLELRGC